MLARVKSPHARKARRSEERGRVTRRFSPFSRGMIFTRARVSLALLSLRQNEGLLVVYCNLLPSVYRPIEIGAAQLRAITEFTPKSAVHMCEQAQKLSGTVCWLTVLALFLNFSDLILRQTLKVSTPSLVVNFICIQNYTYFINSS